MLIHEFLEQSADLHPDNEALVHEGDRISYGALDERANRLARALIAQGVQPHDRVAILCEPCIDFVVAYFATLKTGGVVVGLNTATNARTVGGLLRDSAARAIVVQDRLASLVAEVADGCPELSSCVLAGDPDRRPASTSRLWIDLQEIQRAERPTRPGVRGAAEDLATVIYTSGTTGAPKGVMLSHRNLEANTESIVEYLGLTARDKVMAILPFYYSYGQSLLLTHVRVGGSIVIDNRFAFPNLVVDAMLQEQVTGFSGVPTNFAILLHKSSFAKHKWESLRYVTQAGGPMTPALTLQLREAIPHVKIFVMYGQTEASARLSYLPPDMLTAKLGSIGKAIPGVTLTVRDENGRECPPNTPGEIVAEGDNIMCGYWKQPDETARVLRADGLHTGDLARKDDDGFIYIVGRNSEMIKSGAHRISPKEIEVILAEHEAVLESAVVGVPDEIMGEVIKAVVVLKDGAKVTKRDIVNHCGRNLPPFKMPKIVEFVESLPKTTSGKIQKHLLRAGPAA